ncbi:MAG TPA: hypothetical protein VNR37_02320 [Microbacteriaceae bacterium]|nr:hypothetical protein [Microbacteriaceae bacterium]
MKVFTFIVAFIIFAGSLYLFSLAFAVPGYEALLFTGGIIGVCIAFAIPVHLLKRIQP